MAWTHTPERIPLLIHEALAAATSGRPDPVRVALPIDVASAEVDSGRVARSAVRSGAVRVDGVGAPELIEEAAALLECAARPVRVADSGVCYTRGGFPQS